MLKFSLVFALILSVSLAYDGPAIVSQDQNILRSYGNLGQVSTYSKTLDTPFTSVRKSDVRISNPGVITRPAATAYTHFGYPSLVAASPHHSAIIPTIQHTGYVKSATPIAATYHHLPSIASYAAPTAYTAKTGVISNAGPGANLLGVAYSPSPSVSHMSFSNGLGLTYEW